MNSPGSQITRVKVTARIALGLIWIYEGLIPKFLFLNTDQIALVQGSGLAWRSPETTLHLLGAAQIAMGLWLLFGLRERVAALIASIWMCVLIILVAWNHPALLVDPYGALVKDLSLLASAYAIWVFANPRSIAYPG